MTARLWFSCRHSDDALASKGLDLLGQQLVLPVGGQGDAVTPARRHGDDALSSNGLDLRWLPLVLLVTVAQLAKDSRTPAPHRSVGGEGEAVVISRCHAHGALAAQH